MHFFGNFNLSIHPLIHLSIYIFLSINLERDVVEQRDASIIDLATNLMEVYVKMYFGDANFCNDCLQLCLPISNVSKKEEQLEERVSKQCKNGYIERKRKIRNGDLLGRFFFPTW